MKVAATYSIKGGVGKTSTAVNLAFEAARAGARVLVWDLDPQGAATYVFRVRAQGARREPAARQRRGRPSPSTSAAPTCRRCTSSRPTSRCATSTSTSRAPSTPPSGWPRCSTRCSDHYDLALLDCPPSISLASESVFGAADALLVPVVPATLASRTLSQLVDFLDDQVEAPDVLPLLSMVDRRRKHHRELVEDLGKEWPELLGTVVPSAAVIERMGLERAPVGVYAPSTPATRAYRALWAEVAADPLACVASAPMVTAVVAADVEHFDGARLAPHPQPRRRGRRGRRGWRRWRPGRTTVRGCTTASSPTPARSSAAPRTSCRSTRACARC